MASQGAPIAGGGAPAHAREQEVMRKSGPARDFLGYGDDPPQCPLAGRCTYSAPRTDSRAT
jgi:hypothetical protein